MSLYANPISTSTISRRSVDGGEDRGGRRKTSDVEGGIPRSRGDPRPYLPHAFRFDRSWPIYPHDRFPPLSRSFWPRLRLTSPRCERFHHLRRRLSSTTGPHHTAEDVRHQSYKADRLSRQTTLPLCRATTNVPRFRPVFVHKRGATLFGGTYHSVSPFFFPRAHRLSNHVTLTQVEKSRGC